MLRDQQEPQYVRLRLDFADGDRLAYINPRRIGHVVLVQSSGAFIADTGFGPDALGPAFDEAAFSATLGNRKQAVKAILMDQTRIAGIDISMPMKSCSKRNYIPMSSQERSTERQEALCSPR